MKRTAAVLVASLILAGCNAAQPAQQGPDLEARVQALTQRQQELETRLARVEKDRDELAQELKKVRAEQQAAQARQEALERSMETWVQQVSASVRQAQRPEVNCKDPWTRLEEKLASVDGIPTVSTVETLADMAMREYEACMKAANR